MPLLVRSPEEIFRAEKKDIYVIHSNEEVEEDAPGLVMIQQWIRDQLPGTAMELLAPSEYSGVILGGIGHMVRVDFSVEGLKTFCDRWEINDDSIDPRFQCFIYSYQKWYDKHGCFAPTREKPQGKGPVVWWYTPLGFVHHQLTQEDRREGPNLQHHPANARDIWMRVPELWPELAECDPEVLTYGYIHTDKLGVPEWATYMLPRPWDAQAIVLQPTLDQIRHWFNLPKQVKLLEDDF
jgi:hypothetical protein